MPLIVADFHLPMSLSTVPIAVGKVAYVLLLIPGGMLVDHFGPRKSVLYGLLGMAVLISTYALLVSSFSGLLTIHILLATAASVSGVPIYSIFIAQWFDAGIGLAMGLVLAGYSAAGTLVPAALGPVASSFGWRIAMGFVAVTLWFIGLPVAYYFLHENHQHDELDESHSLRSVGSTGTLERDDMNIEIGDNMSHPPANQTSAAAQPPVLENRSWTFIGFAMSYILLQYCVGCFSENILFFLTVDRGVPLATASLYFSALNFSSFTAKLAGGHLGDRFDRFHVAAATSGLAGVGILVLFCTGRGLDEHYIPRLTESQLTVLLFIVLFGFGYGATFNSLYALVPIVFGRKNLGTTQSSLFGLGLAANAVGSVLTGVLRARYGSYQRPFLIAAVACVANFFTFNITRLTVVGNASRLRAKEEGHMIGSNTFRGLEELEEAEEALRRRTGAPSEDAVTPRHTPFGSACNLLGSGIFGRTFSASPSTEYLLNQPSPTVSKDIPSWGDSLNNLELSAAACPVYDGEDALEGIQPVGGFPIARDWSTGCLQRTLRGSSRPGGSTLQGSRTTCLRRANTAENLIRSGVFSTSLESPGYLGYGLDLVPAPDERPPTTSTYGATDLISPHTALDVAGSAQSSIRETSVRQTAEGTSVVE